MRDRLFEKQSHADTARFAGPVLVSLLVLRSVAVEPPSLDLRLEPVRQWGEATYRIGEQLILDGAPQRLPFPISQLDWPYEAGGLRVSGAVRFAAGWRGYIAGEWTRGRGAEMRDADWEFEELPGTITTYSESRAHLDAWTLDMAVRREWTLWSGTSHAWNASVGLGTRYRDAEWTATNTRQRYPLLPELGEDFIPGRTVKYRLALWMPYLEGCTTWRYARWTANLRMGIAPWLKAADRDDHLLRGILSEADAAGRGGFLEVSVGHEFRPNWALGLSFAHERYRAVGWSENLVYAPLDPDLEPGMRWSIREEIRSSMTRVGLYLRRRW